MLPAVGERLFVHELGALTGVRDDPEFPCVQVLGGSRIADAFSMMKRVLAEGKADRVLTSGLTGEVMLLAEGVPVRRANGEADRQQGADAVC